MTDWTKPYPSADTWLIVRSNNVRRITEDGRHRITEQDAVRIIERFDTKWTNEPTPPNPWH